MLGSRILETIGLWSNRHFRALRKDFRSVFLPMLRHSYSYRTTKLDVFFAYRLLLLRAPEYFDAKALEPRTRELPDVADLMHAFVASPEFREKYHGKNARAEGRVVFVPEGKLRIAVSLDDLVIGWRIVNGTYEPETCVLLRAILHESDICLDIGANVGYLTAIMAQAVGENGSVIAFEPLPQAYRLLEMTVRESDLRNVQLKNLGCGHARSRTKLYYSASQQMGGSYIALGPQAEPEELDCVEVEIADLDSELGNLHRIDFVKMDIEGAEIDALQGMRQLLAAHRPSLVVEINAPCLARNSATPQDLVQFLWEHQYRVFEISSGDAKLREFVLAQPVEVALEINILAVHEDRFEAVCAKLLESGIRLKD
jgi:FkbM family methyltransferase